VTFTGTPGAVVTYTINSGPSQTTTLSAGGTSVVNSGPLAASATYDLVGIQDGTALGCQQAQSGSVTITVGGLPTASISGDATICPGDSATITFSGTPGATVTYTIGAGPGQTTTLDATTGTASVSTGALATTTTYNLVSVSTGGVPPCAQAQSGTATVTVAPLPTATISGSVSICSGDSATITFGGTPGADVSYNIDGGPTQHTTLDAAGTSSVSTGPISLTTTYNLEGVESATAPGCSQAQSGSAVVGVLGLPTAAISGDAAICQGQSSTITFSGTPGATVHYTIGGGPVQAIVLDAGGNAILPTGALSATTLYSLVDAVSASTPACSQSQSGTATITISPLPTATVSGTVSVCQGDASPQVTFTGSDGTPPYVFTYNINSGPSITSDPSTGDSTIILAPTNLTGSFVYNLLSVQDQGGAGCAQGQSGSATVSVGSAPAITAPDPIDVCDDNNDGYAHFDLTQAIAQITGGDATLVVSFHETLTDAQTGNSPIPTPNDFSNIDPGGQTIHVRVVQGAATGCPSLTTLQLNVNRVPVPNTLIDDYHLCDVNNPGDGQEAFTLQDWNGHVDTESGMAFTYYASQSDAQTGTNPLADPYTNTSATGPEQIWVRVQNAATGCFATASFNLVVDPLPQVTPASIAICGGASGVGESFDLTTVSLEVAQGIPGTSTVFYLDQGDALAGNGNTIADPAHFINTSNPQTVYALVRNTATGCFNITTVGLSVGQGPVIGSPQPLVVCDDNNDGHGVFDLTLSYPDIFGSASPPAGVTATIHETITDAQTGDSPIADLTAYHNIDIGQTVYVRATYDATGCYSITPLALEVNPVPVGADVSYPKCDDNTDGLATFDLTTIVGQVLNGMDPSLNTVSFYVDQADAQVPQNPITNLLAFQNTTPGSQVIYAVVADNATGCSDIVEVTLVVSPLPSVPALGATAYTLCDTDNPGDQQQEFDLSSQIPGILAGQSGIDVSFYVSQADAQTPQNPLPMLYTNLSGVNPQTIWVRLEDATTHCAAYTTLDLRVAPLPVLIPPGSPVVVCDPDGDGIAAFDLQALIPDMLQNASGIDVEFYETPANAQSGNNPLANPYTNIDPYNQTLYVGATDTATGCHSVMPLPIKVIPSPQVPPSLSPDHDITMCDQDADNQNGQTAFDLTANEGYILGLQVGAASDYAISYYLSLADAQSGTAPIAQMTDFTNTANAQTIWVRVQGVGTDCYNISHFDLNVVAPAALTHPTNLNVCDDSPTSANPQAVFDLTVKNAEILGASTATLTYYASQGDYAAQVPISDPSAYTNAVNPQTLIVEATSAQGCKSTTTLTIRVIPLPVPRTANLPVPVLEACDENAPTGSEVFDLTLNEDYIRNNDPDLIFQYYDDAGNLIPDPTQAELATGTVHIRVIRNLEQDYQGQLCSVEMTLPVVVNPLPDVHPATATQCALGGVQTATFILSQYNPSLVTGNADDYDFAYYLNLADAQGGNNQLPDSYVNTGGNPQDVTVRVTDKATGCIAYTTLTLNVLAGAEAFPAGLTSCGDTTGSLSVDLSQFDTTVLGAQGAGFSVAYYPTPGDAQNGTNVLSSPLVTASAVLYAVVTNDATGCHSAPSAVTIVIEPLADPMILNSSNTICVDWLTGDLISGLTLVTNLSGNPNYTLEWYYNAGAAPIATGPTYTISDPMGYGSYSVVATSTSALGCVSAPSPVFTVVQSGPAALPVGSTGYTVSSAFDENQTITVTVEGYGSGHYRYQLDNGPILDNGGIFENVPSCANPITGECAHKVTVYDYAGFGDEHCDPLVIEDIHSIDYPRYFTPNGDGTHDHWNISGLDASAKIYIFDRYGKLLKQIKPGAESTGWDGTFNSEPLPSTDYWFVVQYQENGVQREFRAHFSLKR
jgi:gliding motility-associated-like protein